MTQKIILNLSGMHCTSCAMIIEGDLEDKEGVKNAKTNYARQECEVVFDDEKISVEAILAQIQHSGYGANAIVKD